MITNLIILLVLTAAAVWAVVRKSLTRAAIALAVTSIALALIIYRMGSPLAAVFELSVCAGLITVVFMGIISLTEPYKYEEVMAASKGKLKRYGPLVLIIAAAGTGLALMHIPLGFTLPEPETITDPRAVLWHTRQVDIIGQMIVILAGVFGVVVLLKEKKKKKSLKEGN